VSAKTIKADDSYFDKTAKLIPSEAIALFLALSSVIATTNLEDDTKGYYLVGAAAVIGVVVIPIVLTNLYSVTLLSQHFVAVLAFLVWIFNVNYDALPKFTDYPTHERLIGSLVLLLFTFLAPIFVKPRTG